MGCYEKEKMYSMIIPPDTDLSDEELVRRCQAELPHNTQSYELLVQRHMNRIYAIVYRVVSNQEEAEDITQEIFLKIYHHVRNFEQHASFPTWLYRIATNSALDALDKQKRRRENNFFAKGQRSAKQEEDIDQVNLQASTKEGPEEKILQMELRECINQVLKKLNREQAHLLVMRDFEELSYDEITQILEVGLSAVKMRIHRARLAFQQIFLQICDKASLAFSIVSHHESPPEGEKR